MSKEQQYSAAVLDKENTFKGSGTGNYMCYCEEYSSYKTYLNKEPTQDDKLCLGYVEAKLEY